MVKKVIFLESLEVLKQKINGLNFKALKLGLEEIKLEVGEPFTDDSNNVKVRVEIIGQSPKLNGWEVIAKLEYGLNNKHFLKCFGSDNLDLLKYTSLNLACEHCNTNRNRNETYLITNGKEIKQIGTSCLKDFTGHESIEQIVCLLEAVREIKDFNDEELSNNGFPKYKDLERFLCDVSVFVKTEGYRKKEDNLPTADVAYHQGVIGSFITEIDSVKAAINWAKNQNINNTYFHNLKIIFETGYFSYENRFLVASLIPSYLKAVEISELGKDTEYIGSIDEKLNLNCELLSERMINGSYGNTLLYKFAFENAVIVWYSSKDLKLTVGNKYNVVAKVKKHDEFQGIKQTVITRAKVAVAV